MTFSAKLCLSFFSVLLLFISACEKTSDIVIDESSLPSIQSLVAVNGNRTVQLSWPSGSAASAVEIQLHRSSDGSFSASNKTLIATLPTTAIQYSDTGLTNGTTYYYRIVPVMEIANGLRRLGRSEGATPAHPYDYSSIDHIKFSEHIQPIFAGGCAVHGCHAGSDEPALMKQNKAAHDEKFSLKSWADLFKGGDNGAIIIPYKSSKSHILYHMNSDTLFGPVSLPHMPPTSVSIPVNQLQVIKRWIDEGAPDDMGAVAFTANPLGKVLVTNQAEDLVSVIDIETGLVGRYVQAGVANVFAQPPQAPHNVTVDKERGLYYVNLVSAGKVLKFRLSNNEKLGEVSGIISPTQVALSSTGDTAYVAQFSPGVNAIRLIDTRTMTLVGQISNQYLDKPHGVQVTPDFKELWVTGNFSDNIMVVNLQDFSTSLIQLNNQAPGLGGDLLPYQTAMTSDNRWVYVSCQKSNEVLEIFRDSMKVMERIPVGEWPLIMAMTPDDGHVVVANRNSNNVSIIKTHVSVWMVGDSLVATIPNVGPGPHGVAVTNDGKYAYVSCENVLSPVPPHHPTAGSKIPGYVAVIDLQFRRVIRQIEVGAFAAGVAVVE